MQLQREDVLENIRRPLTSSKTKPKFSYATIGPTTIKSGATAAKDANITITADVTAIGNHSGIDFTTNATSGMPIQFYNRTEPIQISKTTCSHPARRDKDIIVEKQNSGCVIEDLRREIFNLRIQLEAVLKLVNATTCTKCHGY